MIIHFQQQRNHLFSTTIIMSVNTKEPERTNCFECEENNPKDCEWWQIEIEMVEEGNGFFDQFVRQNDHKYEDHVKLLDAACKHARFQSYRHYHFCFGSGAHGVCTPLPLCVEGHIKKTFRYSTDEKENVGYKSTELRAKEFEEKRRKDFEEKTASK